MKTAIVYASVHHGNTLKIVEALSKKFNIDLIDATRIHEKDITSYDRIGFASGIYYGQFHQSVLNFAAINLPRNREVFYICTYGGKENYKSISEATRSKSPKLIGSFSCKGYDTYGPFKIIGGLQKGHPDEEDINNAVSFYENLL